MMTGHTIPKELMTEFVHLLVENMGLHYPQDQWPDLEKKLWKIMHAFGFREPESCLQWLKRNPLNREQITLLAQHLTIGETYFFRDPHTFAALKETIFPDLLKKHQIDRTIRIWSAGCCTGEEPYSIAILLHQMLPHWQSWNIEILGTDINPEFLRKAEQGCYKKWSFRTTPSEIINKYFVKHSHSTYLLIPEIKNCVRFAYLNLAEERYLTNKIQEMDLIICHNVLIYFSQTQIKKIIHRFAHALKEHAWLSLSAIEVPFVSDKYFVLHQYSGAFFFQKDTSKRAVQYQPQKQAYPLKEELPAKDEMLLKVVLPAFLQASHAPTSLDIRFFEENSILPEKTTVKVESNEHAEKNLYETCLDLIHHKQYGEALSKLLAYLSPHQQDENFLLQNIKETILIIQIYANQGDLTNAMQWIERALQADKLNPILYYLQATVLDFLGDISSGIKSLKRALFLDPNFVVAHYMLGVLEKRLHNAKAAQRSFNTALELLQNYQTDEILPGTEELTAGYLKDLLEK